MGITWKTLEFPRYRPWKIAKITLENHGKPWNFNSDFGWEPLQCSCNALYAICFSIVKKVSIWKSYDLDYILEKGDKTFKLLGISLSLFMCELPHNIMIENAVMEVDMLSNYFGLLGKDNIFENNASVRETGNGLIFMTGGFMISLIWSKKFSFLI